MAAPGLVLWRPGGGDGAAGTLLRWGTRPPRPASAVTALRDGDGRRGAAGTAALRDGAGGACPPCMGLSACRLPLGVSLSPREHLRFAFWRRVWSPDPEMRKVLCVEPVIFIYIFASSLTSPLVQQFIYRRLWEQEYNSTFVSDSNVSHCEQNKSSPAYIKQKASGGGGIIIVNNLAARRCCLSITSCFITLTFNSPESRSFVTCSHFTVSSL